ncbi:MAG: hypothetical protein WCF23_14755 [Candidatus Nitrosopolaris sp.]
MEYSANIKNFRISGLTIIGIAIALIIFGGVLAIPPVDSKTSSSHHSKSSRISGDSFNNVGKSNVKTPHAIQTTSNNSIVGSDSNTDSNSVSNKGNNDKIR